VLINRRGIVTMYHPGALSYEELRAEIEKVIAPSAGVHREFLHRGATLAIKTTHDATMNCYAAARVLVRSYGNCLKPSG
jgi:hypothetical protein